MPDFKSYISMLRLQKSLLMALAVYIGSVITGGYAVPDREIIVAMTVAFFVAGGCFVVNDILDSRIDSVNKPNRPIPSGRISMRAAYTYSILLFLTANSISFIYLNTELFYISAAATILAISYNIKLRQYVFIGQAIASILVSLTIVFGSFVRGSGLNEIFPFAILIFLAYMGMEVFKTIEEALGDKHINITTIALKYGVFKTKIIGSILIITTVAISIIPYIIGYVDVVYLGFIIIADVVFVTAVVMPMKHSSKLIYAGIYVMLTAFLLGAWSVHGVF